MSSPYPFSLPSNPNLEQLRNQAKDLLKAFKEGDADVPPRLRRSIPEMADLSDAEVFRSRFALKGARRVIAREYGFTEWTDLKREVETAHVQDDLDANTAHEHTLAARASLALGDLAGARRSADALWELAKQTPDVESADGQPVLWKANLLKGVIAYAEGEWRIAKVHFRYCDENLTGHRGEWELHAAWAILENEVGHRAEARRRLKAVTGNGDDPDGERLSMAAFISASIGRTTENARMLDAAERLGRDVLSKGASDHVEARARIALAFVAVERGDTLSAREQYDALLPYRGVLTNGHPPITDRVLGLLAQTLGRIDDAAGHFEAALAFCRDRFHGEQGHVSYEYAVLLFARCDPGDRERAIELMLDAYEKCHWVSHDRMRPLHKRVMDLNRAEGWSYPMRELHVSIKEGRFDEYLRRYQFTPEQMNLRHIYGSSVITSAASTRDPETGKRGRNQEVLQALIDAGAEFDIFGAVAWGLSERIEEILDDDPSLLNSKRGFSSLMNVPFHFDQLETAELLLERGYSLPIPMGGSDEWIRWAVAHGANVNGPRNDGWPLNHQAGHGRMKGVATLLELGADPNPQDEQGNTPMHRLAKRGTGREFARLLLEHGADLSIRNVKGETPMDLAAKAKQPALLNLLREHLQEDGS